MIIAENIYKVYSQGDAKVEALKGIDVKIEEGQRVLIVGPSGAGKSTLLHVLGGLETPTVGRVLFNGIDFYKMREGERAKIRNEKLGFVFQSYHLFADFNALENVMLPAFIRGRRERRRAEELLEMVGLKDRMRHRPNELSGGEAQRVAIARALMNNPDVILCDEPTGNLDSETGGLIYKILWRINKEDNKTLIVVTHNESVREDFNRIYYIGDGGIDGRGQFSPMRIRNSENSPR